MRNSKWHRDEIILALNLYFDPSRGPITSSNPKVIELSETLNELRLPVSRNDEQKFRNPNGVSLKLSNFLAIDPAYSGVGMEKFSKLDKETFDKFLNDKNSLRREVQRVILSINKL